MKEVIVRLTSDHIKIKGGEYVQDLVRCGKCKYKRINEDGETRYYYCALEDRPNRQWSVDDTDYCSWGEVRDEQGVSINNRYCGYVGNNNTAMADHPRLKEAD